MVGLVPNPLLRYPRNAKCICSSGKKFKHCHLDKLPSLVPKEMADDAKQLLAKVEKAGTFK